MNTTHRIRRPLFVMAATGSLLLVLAACAHASLRDRWLQRRQAQASTAPITLPAGVRVIHDVAYGSDPRQRFDVYLPDRPLHDAPVIFMVHGGGWRIGDKANRNVVQNKAARWVPRGIVLISVNYRLLPDAKPLAQADDVARALALAQARAADWGADPERFVLMGHSAGAHLVALLTARPGLARAHGAGPWLGTVALDSAVMDLPTLMKARHLRLYDDAFGSDPAGWRAASPLAQLQADGPPMLMICSSRRRDACPQAQAMAEAATALGRRMRWQAEDLSHRQINAELGLPSDYTRTVESFMATLDPGLARALAVQP